MTTPKLLVSVQCRSRTNPVRGRGWNCNSNGIGQDRIVSIKLTAARRQDVEAGEVDAALL